MQGQILALLSDLQREFGTAVLLVTHDLGVIAQVADRALVMYRGAIVEQASAAELLSSLYHPYISGLVACVPTLDSNEKSGLCRGSKGGCPH